LFSIAGAILHNPLYMGILRSGDTEAGVSDVSTDLQAF